MICKFWCFIWGSRALRAATDSCILWSSANVVATVVPVINWCGADRAVWIESEQIVKVNSHLSRTFTLEYLLGSGKFQQRRSPTQKFGTTCTHVAGCFGATWLAFGNRKCSRCSAYRVRHTLRWTMVNRRDGPPLALHANLAAPYSWRTLPRRRETFLFQKSLFGLSFSFCLHICIRQSTRD